MHGEWMDEFRSSLQRDRLRKFKNPTNGRDGVKTQNTIGLQPRGISVSTWRAKQWRFLDTTDFSRVEVQFLPNVAAPKKTETETLT